MCTFPSPVFYSEKLLGLQRDCEIGGCREAESSTGWLLAYGDDERYYIEFECAVHGRGGTWRPEWQPLIEAVLKLKTEESADGSAGL